MKKQTILDFRLKFLFPFKNQILTFPLMANIPLEDSFADVIGKAQRGLKISDDDLSGRAGITNEILSKLKSGEFDETAARKVAPVLNLAANALVELGTKSWYPPSHEVAGLASFNTVFEDMTVNSYLVFDPQTKEAVAFDTGADASPMLKFAKENSLKIKLILLTHIHPDHIADLEKLKIETGAPAHVCELEPVAGAETFKPGKVFSLGNLKITQCIPANTPPVFQGLRPRIWPHLLRLVTNGNVGQAPSPADCLTQRLSPSDL